MTIVKNCLICKNKFEALGRKIYCSQICADKSRAIKFKTYRKTRLKKLRDRNRGNLDKIKLKFKLENERKLKSLEKARNLLLKKQNNKIVEKKTISKADAKKQGLKRYFTAIPCKYGHVDFRAVSTGDCFECRRSRSREYSKTDKYKSYIINYRNTDQYKKSREKTVKKYLSSEKGYLTSRINSAKLALTDKARKYRSEYDKDRRIRDPQYKLTRNLRSLTYQYLKRKKGEKKDKFIDLIGCNLENLKIHLEKKFLHGMTWDNYGEWHVDHIIPCAAFNLSIEEEQKRCFHFTNLQPLWAKDNLSKGGRTSDT